MSMLTDIPELKYIKRRDDSRNHSWQFQFDRESLQESKLFSDSKYGSKEAALVAAKAYRDQFILTAIELGLLDPTGKVVRNPLPINLKLSPKNTSGIIGIYRENLARKGRETRELAWVAGYQDETGKNKQKSFPIPTLGERQALLAAIRFRREFVNKVAQSPEAEEKRPLIVKHLEDLDFLIEYIELLSEDSELFPFLSTLNNPAIKATEKEAMLAIRIGQARFRSLVLALWDGACAITKATNFLVAGHIKPWSVATDQERLDPYNGIPLSPVYDKAFDAGLITFGTDGAIVVSDKLRSDAPKLGITGGERLRIVRAETLKYLAYHQAHRFIPR